jgi:formylglycine-generating enzyme required for sulfatase activity
MRTGLVLLMVALGAMAQAPREFTNSVGMKFVRIAPGSFKMGAVEGHEVTLSKGFYLQMTEVTQAQWQAVMRANPSQFKGPDRPVESASWADIQEFLRKLNAREKGTRYRLPTEAEWEYACRAGGQEPDVAPNLGDVAWWWENSRGQTHPVGQKKPNAWGLYDMRGNVWEWVKDRRGRYTAERQVDPKGPSSGGYRVVRGGAWDFNQTVAACSHRYFAQPLFHLSDLGFRCARTF